MSLAVLRRQIAAMPCRLYEVRLIHSDSRKPYPGVRQWTVSQLLNPATVGFLRIRNREGYDVYFRPYAGDHNAGQAELNFSLVGQMRCRRNDQFTRQRDDGAFDGHQERDERIAAGGERAQIPIDQCLEHARWL